MSAFADVELVYIPEMRNSRVAGVHFSRRFRREMKKAVEIHRIKVSLLPQVLRRFRRARGA